VARPPHPTTVPRTQKVFFGPFTRRLLRRLPQESYGCDQSYVTKYGENLITSLIFASSAPSLHQSPCGVLQCVGRPFLSCRLSFHNLCPIQAGTRPNEITSPCIQLIINTQQLPLPLCGLQPHHLERSPAPDHHGPVVTLRWPRDSGGTSWRTVQVGRGIFILSSRASH